MSSRRFQLRARTARLHAELDAAVGAFDSQQAYRCYLRRLLAFREPVEQAFAMLRLPCRLVSCCPHQLGDAIRRDMADLQVPPPVRPPTPKHLVELLRAVPGVLGTTYVLEGSTLGAKLLYRRAQALGLTDTFAARHLAQQATANRWVPFLDLLEREPDLDMEAVIHAATVLFELARRAFVDGALAQDRQVRE